MALDWTQALTFGAIAIITPVVIRGMGKLFPSKSPIPSEQEFSDMEVQKWHLIGFGVYIVLWPIIGIPLWLLLSQVYQWYASFYGSATIFIGSPSAALSISVLLATLVLAAIPLDYMATNPA